MNLSLHDATNCAQGNNSSNAQLTPMDPLEKSRKSKKKKPKVALASDPCQSPRVRLRVSKDCPLWLMLVGIRMKLVEQWLLIPTIAQ
ncbi:hypothetical protein PIB30_061483 [Stylosanthes scabra]|uniref:Uncharacterized protein n=1 Tax=Stylosanthes scabra TaxID=79078 RepID=A0ABU6ZJK7_9FABA|nr:hypothetical protein [Stylosanthes scabra]